MKSRIILKLFPGLIIFMFMACNCSGEDKEEQLVVAAQTAANLENPVLEGELYLNHLNIKIKELAVEINQLQEIIDIGQATENTYQRLDQALSEKETAKEEQSITISKLDWILIKIPQPPPPPDWQELFWFPHSGHLIFSNRVIYTEILVANSQGKHILSINTELIPLEEYDKAFSAVYYNLKNKIAPGEIITTKITRVHKDGAVEKSTYSSKVGTLK